MTIFATFTSSFVVAVTDGDDGDSRGGRVTNCNGLLSTTTCHTASVTAATAAAVVLLTAARLLCSLNLMTTCMRCVRCVGVSKVTGMGY